MRNKIMTVTMVTLMLFGLCACSDGGDFVEPEDPPAVEQVTIIDDPTPLVVETPSVDVPTAQEIIDTTENAKLDDMVKIGDKLKEDAIGDLQSPKAKVEDAIEEASDEIKVQPQTNFALLASIMHQNFVKIDLSPAYCRNNETGYILSAGGVCKKIESAKRLTLEIKVSDTGGNSMNQSDLKISLIAKNGTVHTYEIQKACTEIDGYIKKTIDIENDELIYPDSFDRFEITTSAGQYTPVPLFHATGLKLTLDVKLDGFKNEEELIIYNAPCLDRYFSANNPSKHTLFNDLVVCSLVATAQQILYCNDATDTAFCANHSPDFYDGTGTNSTLTLNILKNGSGFIAIPYSKAGESDLEAGNVDYFGRTLYDQFSDMDLRSDSPDAEFLFTKVGEKWRWKVDGISTWIFNANPRLGVAYPSERPIQKGYYFSEIHTNGGWIDDEVCVGDSCRLPTLYKEDGFNYSIMDTLWNGN